MPACFSITILTAQTQSLATLTPMTHSMGSSMSSPPWKLLSSNSFSPSEEDFSEDCEEQGTYELFHHQARYSMTTQPPSPTADK